MADRTRLNRRAFIVSTSAAAVGAAALGAGGIADAGRAEQDRVPHLFRSPSGSVVPYQQRELIHQGPQRTFSGEALAEIAFPLGGIGTGTVSLGGRGELRDWEIFNRPGIGQVLPFTFVAIWARAEGDRPSVRAVEAPLQPPYHGSFGVPRLSAQGMPRLGGVRFTGAYPFARLDFEDAALPVEISLEAFNPFIPLDVDDSSLPVAILHYRIASRSDRPVDLALAFSMLNAVGFDGTTHLANEQFEGFGQNLTTVRTEPLAGGHALTGLDMVSRKYGPGSLRHGSLSLVTLHPDVTAQPAWPGRAWFDSFQTWLNDFTPDGEFEHPASSAPSDDGRSSYGTLAPRARLRPGEQTTITFILAWHFPVRENYWNPQPEVHGATLRNDYGRRFESAWAVAHHTATHLDRLERRTREFHDALFSSTLPAHVLDAVSSQASIIRTNTGVLLDNQTFYGFEGCRDDSGCCPMNCTHVWNYEQALAQLFPQLERSMRHTDFTANVRPDGSMAFRTLVPVGRALWKFRPAADGQMGTILKLYREWQISGDDRFLRELWPAAKRSLEYAWFHWDADRDGVMEGEQHNTYDIEFYGPNSMMGTLYLGALKAGALMADAVGDREAAATYRRIFETGRVKLEATWNGEYYEQHVPPVERLESLPWEEAETWHAPAIVDGEVKYQYGTGCLSDQLLGQWFATVVGLGDLLEPERIGTALKAIYRYNFKHDFYDHPNAQRIYALNDEKGLLLCSWPKGGRPALPFVYADEVWTGIEYQVAAHLIYAGHLFEGLAIVKATRDRYDGRRRNPWNEVECGSHYARALASWSVLLALAGYSCSAPARRLTFKPRMNPDNFRSLFMTGSGWGVFHQRIEPRALSARLETRYGTVRLRRLIVGNTPGWTSGTVVSATGPGGRSIPTATLALGTEELAIDFGRDIEMIEGGALDIRLAPGTKV